MSLLPAPDQWPAEGRRIAYVHVSPQALVMLLHDLREGHRVTVAGLPPDARAVTARYDHYYDCVVVTLESQAFEPVPLAAVAPVIQVQFTDETAREMAAAMFGLDESQATGEVP